MATQDDIYRESQRTADAVGEATEALQDIAQDLEKARNNPTQDPETLKLLVEQRDAAVYAVAAADEANAKAEKREEIERRLLGQSEKQYDAMLKQRKVTEESKKAMEDIEAVLGEDAKNNKQYQEAQKTFNKQQQKAQKLEARRSLLTRFKDTKEEKGTGAAVKEIGGTAVEGLKKTFGKAKGIFDKFGGIFKLLILPALLLIVNSPIFETIKETIKSFIDFFDPDGDSPFGKNGIFGSAGPLLGMGAGTLLGGLGLAAFSAPFRKAVGGIAKLGFFIGKKLLSGIMGVVDGIRFPKDVTSDIQSSVDGGVDKDDKAKKAKDKKRKQKKPKGRLGRLFSGAGKLVKSVAGGAGRAGGAIASAGKGVVEGAKKAGSAIAKSGASMGSKAAGVIGKGARLALGAARFAGPVGLGITAAMGIFDGVSAGVEEFKKSGKFGSAVQEGLAGAASGLTFGLVSQETISGGLSKIGSFFTGDDDDAIAEGAGVVSAPLPKAPGKATATAAGVPVRTGPDFKGGRRVGIAEREMIEEMGMDLGDIDLASGQQIMGRAKRANVSKQLYAIRRAREAVRKEEAIAEGAGVPPAVIDGRTMTVNEGPKTENNTSTSPSLRPTGSTGQLAMGAGSMTGGAYL